MNDGAAAVVREQITLSPLNCAPTPLFLSIYLSIYLYLTLSLFFFPIVSIAQPIILQFISRPFALFLAAIRGTMLGREVVQGQGRETSRFLD